MGNLLCHEDFAQAFLSGNSLAQFNDPVLLLSLKRVLHNFQSMRAGLPAVDMHFAVKACPVPEVISALAAAGASFDVASMGEVLLCLANGATPNRMSFGNVVKSAQDIRMAYALGISLFAADAEEELRKIACNAPGASVYIRMLIGDTEAEWPLSDKSGCTPAMALHLFDKGRALGLRMRGISFHVGSQTRNPDMWIGALDQASSLWKRALSQGHQLDLLNIGGGFPARYGRPITEITPYCERLCALLSERFDPMPKLIAEPGRGLVADAGLIVAEVLLVSRKDEADEHRWVFLNIGKFSGLAETMEEAIRYSILTTKDGAPTGPCVLAGPSCDSADVLYQKNMIDLPLTLAAGDRVLIEETGAYTASYSSVGFNGFPPLKTVIV